MSTLNHHIHTHEVHGSRGVTLIDTLVAVALFSVVIVIVVGSLTSLIDANRKARSERSVLDNMNAALESMGRAMRSGTTYHCGSATPYSAELNCPTGSSVFAFEKAGGNMNDSGDQVVYRLNTSDPTWRKIERSLDSGATWEALTGRDVQVMNLIFQTISFGIPNEQPKVLISIVLRAGQAGKPETQSEFTLQTTVSQRLRIVISSGSSGGAVQGFLTPNSEESPGPAPVLNTGADSDCSGTVCYLYNILADFGYTILPSYNDQTEVQHWDNSQTGDVDITLTFLRGHPQHASFRHVFGYYFDGDMSTFTPIFQDGNPQGICPPATQASEGDTVTYTLPAGSFDTIGFAICSQRNGVEKGEVATEAALNNPSSQNRVAVFNPSPGIYIMGFEDIVGTSGVDRDYNDFIVVLESTGFGDVGGEAETPVAIEEF